MPAAQRRKPSILAQSQNLAGGRIYSVRGFKICLGDPQTPAFVGAQVRVPISELKAWLEEKLAY